MKPTYTIIVSGYEPIRAEWALKEARKELRDILKEEVARCMKRFGRATLHRKTPNTGRVTIGKDFESAMWCSATIIPS